MRRLLHFQSRWQFLLLTVVALAAATAQRRPGDAAGQQQGAPIGSGWSNVLYTGPSGPIGTVLGSLADNLTGVIIWDPQGQRYHSYLSASPQAGDLQNLLSGQVYWFSFQAPAVLPSGQASPAPTQVMFGWNNVAYFGPGAPGSSVLEQSPVWQWDAGSQRWLHRDPASPASSDFQALTPSAAYWVFVPGGATPNPASAPPTPASAPSAPGTHGGCYPFTGLQPSLAEIDDALTRGGLAALAADPQLSPPPEHGGTTGAELIQPAYVPPSLLRAIAWAESSWHQATWATQRGQTGPTMASTGCAYGLMQIASGMSIASSPTPVQQEIGTDFRANVAAGVQLLVRNWNRDASALPIVGRHEPDVVEDWYYAVWAYHCFGPACAGYGAHDNPDDPALPWPRPAFNSSDQLASTAKFDSSAYPYQELVYGLVQNPPAVDGRPLWRAINVQLPTHGSVGYPQPQAIPEPSAHLEDGRTAPSP